ncbi:MAG: MerR family transcriptional regulator [Pseudopedobacter saltans]|uniref:MerR family transcriptional regulator n=1 Tax=Pseudopedobacter saltans TaxID=151895 RepID=A0A2W5F1N8_9SPHI|nr:MAG: MerR family transcriptional regulator [Pseudopedobacter saltans]
MPQLDEVAVPNQEVAPAENLLEKDIEDNTGEDLVLDEKNDFNQLVEVKQEEKLVEEPKPLAERFGKKGRKSFKEIDAEVDLIQVPSDEILFSKQYYPISQVAKWFRVNNSLLRFWENEFEILKPRKNRKGDRLFRPEDIKNLQIIYYLLRQKKYTIAGARKFIKNNRKTVDVNMKVVQTLNDFKRFLLELKANSER